MKNSRRISVAGTVATLGGTLLSMFGVVLGAGLAFANPPGAPSLPGGSYGGGYGAPADDTAGLDLPIGAPVYSPDAGKPKPKPAEDPQGEDPRDTPPPTFAGEELSPATQSILYVIDQSGSMTIAAEPFQDENGQVKQGNRLDRAKAELKRSIAALSENFFFNIYFYDECVMACFAQRTKANAENKAAAFAWVDRVQPDGWTNTGLAVATALADKENKTVVVLSDGAPNFLDCAMQYVGSFDQHAQLIRTTNTQGAVINSFGIGISGDPDARGFMQRIAVENGGTYMEID